MKFSGFMVEHFLYFLFDFVADAENEVMEEKIIVSSTSRWLLLLLICALNGYLAQKNTDPNPNSGWTFSKQESFVAFSPNLTLEQDQEIMFSFRTRSPNGLLFCHLVEHFNQSVHPLLRNYHFCAELSHGFLQVKYSLNQISDVMNLGKGEHREWKGKRFNKM